MARQRSFGTRTARREMVWIGLFPAQAKIALAAGQVILMGTLNAAALALRPFTVVRTRGFLWTASDQEGAIEEPFGAFGLMVVKQTASAAGIASLPTPVTESDGEFFVYEPWIAAMRFVSATGIADPAGSTIHFDSKAQRKLGLDEDLAVTIENESSTHGADVIIGGRILVKLH